MILNTGLDAACTTSANSGSSQSYPNFCAWLRYACFGAGSSAPSITDTLLDAQVGARSDNRGGFNNSEAGGLDQNTNTIWYESEFTRVFSVAGNVNATEWGLAPAASGNLSVRELFRADPLDNSSSPITLTLEDGDQLQLVVTLRVEAAWEYESKSFVITGTAGNDTNGTHEGAATITTGAGSSQSAIRDALGVAWPGGSTTINHYLHALLTDVSGAPKDADFPTGAETASLSSLAYTPGAFCRDWEGTFSTSAANGEHYAWAATNASSGGASTRNQGYRFILTNPPYLTKLSTHRLTLTLRKHISRL